MMKNNQDIISVCEGDPSHIFTLIKQEEYKLVGELIVSNIVNINTKDNLDNDVMTRLLKAKQYDLVIILMKKKNWNVNNQNVKRTSGELNLKKKKSSKIFSADKSTSDEIIFTDFIYDKNIYSLYCTFSNGQIIQKKYKYNNKSNNINKES